MKAPLQSPGSEETAGEEIEIAGTSEIPPATPVIRALRPGGLSKVLSSVFALDGVVAFVADKDEAAMGMCPAPIDFELLRVVGQGAFGKVFQVKQRATGRIFAMKVMRKDKVLAKNHSEYMRQERDILTDIDHPFIVKMHYSFQTSTKLYLILDFVNGGHLFFQLYRQGMFDESLARVYCAEIVLAVAHLHGLGVAHRDLKPENVLLDHTGHVVLTDFGLAKRVKGDTHTNSMCGTMEYMAPEVVTAKGHGRPADWWSVGVLLFEMLTGKHPFSARNRQLLQKKILSEKLKLPPYLTQEAASLLKGLLTRDPKARLGTGEEGIDKIKKHAFFRGVNWKRVEERQLTPPFRPDVDGDMCVANFDEDFTSLPAEDNSPCTSPTPELTAKAKDHFSGFSFVSPTFLIRSSSAGSSSAVHASPSGLGLAAGGRTPLAADSSPRSHPFTSPADAAAKAELNQPAVVITGFDHSVSCRGGGVAT